MTLNCWVGEAHVSTDRKEIFFHNYEPECDLVPPKLAEDNVHYIIKICGQSTTLLSRRHAESVIVACLFFLKNLMHMFALGLGLA